MRRASKWCAPSPPRRLKTPLPPSICESRSSRQVPPSKSARRRHSKANPTILPSFGTPLAFEFIKGAPSSRAGAAKLKHFKTIHSQGKHHEVHHRRHQALQARRRPRSGLPNAASAASPPRKSRASAARRATPSSIAGPSTSSTFCRRSSSRSPSRTTSATRRSNRSSPPRTRAGSATGKIFVMDLEHVCRIRTGETDDAAV